VPVEAPSGLLNRWTVSAFNAAYYARNGLRGTEVTDYEPFFFPLDGVGGWNKIYGRRGFYQYQNVIPLAETATLRKIMAEVAKSGSSSFLAVLKRFGKTESPGMLSFPMEGWTLALDFPNRGEATEALFRRLDELTFAAGGRLYAAKDARMTPEAFALGAPRLAEFQRHVDPACRSDLARRLRIIP
jgi:L-gulonolactone oxidase